MIAILESRLKALDGASVPILHKSRASAPIKGLFSAFQGIKMKLKPECLGDYLPDTGTKMVSNSTAKLWQIQGS